MTRKIPLFWLLGLLLCFSSLAQKPAKQPDIDTSFSDMDYEELFNELDLLLDSLTAPRSFGMFTIGVGNGYFDYQSKSTYLPEAIKKIAYSPSLAWYSKTGLGISASTDIIHDGVHVNPYQLNVTGSYDYLKNSKFLTGVAFTHFFTKDSLPFYTSPLKNEIYSYFTYRSLWLKPSVGLSYGWGSRNAYEERKDYITSLRLLRNGFTRVNTRESVNDFNVITSVRHDFYWLNVIGRHDYIRLTPQIVFTSGTQKFGFNQSSSSYATLPRTGANVLYRSENVYLGDELNFQPLALSTYLKAEYSRGKFFVQPQLILDYYFPANDKNFSMAVAVNAGVIF